MAHTTYFAVLTTSVVHGLPTGVTNPGGIYTSLAAAAAAIHETEEVWAEHGLSFPHCNVRVHEYASRRQAERADVSDGMVLGERGGRKLVQNRPLSTWGLPLPVTVDA